MINPIPELPYGCGSWVIVRKGTNEAVVELFNRSLVERINFKAYEALTAIEYLTRINAERKLNNDRLNG